jgi:hypothetical protein
VLGSGFRLLPLRSISWFRAQRGSVQRLRSAVRSDRRIVTVRRSLRTFSTSRSTATRDSGGGRLRRLRTVRRRAREEVRRDRGPRRFQPSHHAGFGPRGARGSGGTVGLSRVACRLRMGSDEDAAAQARGARLRIAVRAGDALLGDGRSLADPISPRTPCVVEHEELLFV